MPARRPVELTIPVFRRFGQATALVTLLVMPLAVPAAITSGLTHHWNFDEGPDWHDAPFGSVATISTALDLAGGWNATLVNLAGRILGMLNKIAVHCRGSLALVRLSGRS